MSEIAIIGDLDTVTGFKLGGVKKGKVVKARRSRHEGLVCAEKRDSVIESCCLFLRTCMAQK